MMICTKYLLLLFGVVLTCQANPQGNIERQQAQTKIADEKDTEVKSLKPILKVKTLNDDQKKLLYDSNPKMIERTKILNKVRKLKDQGEERTKVIYRTRVIGLFNPKMIGNLNLIDKVFEESNEEFDYSDVEDGHRKSDNVKEEINDIDKVFEKATNCEMPPNQHSSKKELHNDPNAVKSFKNLSDKNKAKETETVYQTKSNLENASKSHKPFTPLKKVNFIDATVENGEPELKQPKNLYEAVKNGDVMFDENLTMFNKPPGLKENFVDSLELYRQQQQQQQQKKEEAFNQLRNFVNNNILHLNSQPKPRPPLQRQFSVYRPIVNGHNNHVKNTEVKNESVNTPPYHQSVQTNSKSVPLNRINTGHPEQQTLQPDWISSLLMNRFAQAEAAQMHAKQAQMNPHQRDQQILQREQHHQQIAA